MNSANLAIQIIPDLTIDDKYSTVINDTQARIKSFTDNALKNGRLEELFTIETSGMTQAQAERLLRAEGRLSVGFQFETHPDASEENFRIFARKTIGEDKKYKFYPVPAIHEILFQLISLEDRRTVAIFSMMNSNIDTGYRILTTLYGNQLKRLVVRASQLITDEIAMKLEKLSGATVADASQLWEQKAADGPASGRTAPQGARRASEENILSVMADETTFSQINQYVENVVSRRQRIQEKRKQLEENPDLSRDELYEQMIQEDFSQLENCYARMHIYLKAYYKSKHKRNNTRNRILRQFFGAEIEHITGETGLLEDLLALNKEEYFKNIDRHHEL